MIKKIAALAGAGVLMVASTGMAFAYYGHHRGVRTTLTSEANTGNNVQGNSAVGEDGDFEDWADVSGNNTMRTGDATARTRAGVIVRTHRPGKVMTTLTSGANTGNNVQGNYAEAGDDVEGDVSGNNSMTTGNATATSRAFVVVGGSWHWDD